jgi:hypothetical protein
MRKSASIRLGLLLAAAAGCGDSERRCVDDDQRAVDPVLCLEGDAGPQAFAGRHYHYWYGGSRLFFFGPVFGGSSFRGSSAYRSSGGSVPGGSVSSPSGVSRGGFGSTGAAHAGGSAGGSAGGAHGGSSAGS